jgi:hypothetical protein
VVSVTPLLLFYPPGKDPRYPLDRRLDGPQSWTGHRRQPHEAPKVKRVYDEILEAVLEANVPQLLRYAYVSSLIVLKKIIVCVNTLTVLQV